MGDDTFGEVRTDKEEITLYCSSEPHAIIVFALLHMALQRLQC